MVNNLKETLPRRGMRVHLEGGKERRCVVVESSSMEQDVLRINLSISSVNSLVWAEYLIVLTSLLKSWGKRGAERSLWIIDMKYEGVYKGKEILNEIGGSGPYAEDVVDVSEPVIYA